MISPELVASAASIPREALHERVLSELGRSASYRSMQPERRDQIANDTERVLAFLADPGGGLADAPGRATATAMAQQRAPAGSTSSSRPPAARGLAEEPPPATGVARGVEQFDHLVDTVDFPKFVSGLIEGVFTSIVDSSIKQMDAYGKLLENVVKSVEEFARENYSDDAARQNLADRFPNALKLDSSSGMSRLMPRGDDGGGPMPDFKSLFGMDVNLEEEESEKALVQRARVEMARAKQQMLATMVVLGINRIIVTDGEIKASVVFDVKATESASTQYDASRGRTSNSNENYSGTRQKGGGWFSSPDSTDNYQNTYTTVTTSSSNFKSNTAEEIEAKAKLTGSVTVKFRSETFPLERMASSLELGEVQKKSTK